MGAFLASPCVVASGSDETIASVRERLAPAARLVAYGHRLSVAVVAADALGSDTAAALARDVAAWDQLGCLSPVAAFVVGAGAGDVTDFAREVADALAVLEAEQPRGEVDAGSAAAIRRERDVARMRDASGDAVFASEAGTAWTVVVEPTAGDAVTRPAPLHRFLRIAGAANTGEVASALTPIGRWLSTIATAGLAEAEHVRVAAIGGHRTRPPGEMQTPPLGWERDGIALLRPLRG